MSAPDTINALVSILGYPIGHRNAFWQAMQAAGSGYGGPDGNKKLAMIGDTVMKLVLLHDIALGDVSRGDIDSSVQKIVANNNLAQRCDEVGLTQLIKGNPSQDGAHGCKTRAATISAILAAVYLDSGEDIARVRQVMNVLGLKIDKRTSE